MNKLSKAIKVANMETQRGNIFNEKITTPHGVMVSIFSARRRSSIYVEELCYCGNSDFETCECEYIYPATPRLPFKRMKKALFDEPKPVLLYTIYQENNPDVKFLFASKYESDVLEETKRLTNKTRGKKLWLYRVEAAYNSRTIADHEYYHHKATNQLD